MTIADLLSVPNKEDARKMVLILEELIPLQEQSNDKRAGINKVKLDICKRYLKQFGDTGYIRASALVEGEEYHIEYPNGEKGRVKFIEFIFGTDYVFLGIEGNHPENEMLTPNFVIPSVLFNLAKVSKV